MTPEDKRLIVESVGLHYHCWLVKDADLKYIQFHGTPEWIEYECYDCKVVRKFVGDKCKNAILPQLDPLSPSDMYGKIWKAFKKMGEDYKSFCSQLYTMGVCSFYDYEILTSAPDLAVALLEYFKKERREGKDG